MITLREIYEGDSIGQIAFEIFADVHPHEAAELDWEKFVAYTRERCGHPNLSEEDIHRILGETA